MRFFYFILFLVKIGDEERMYKEKVCSVIKKSVRILYFTIGVVLPIILTESGEVKEEPILGGKPCDLKNTFMVKYCEDDKKVIVIVKKISGTIPSEELKINEKLEEHKSHTLVNKLMCLKFAYGCPRCQFWARSFSGGNCPYCGGKLVKSKYWSPVLVVLNEKICLFTGIFPHVKEE